MALYEITITASKCLYIEADSEEAAVDSEMSQNEFSAHGDIDFEVADISAKKLDKKWSSHVREHHSHLVFID